MWLAKLPFNKRAQKHFQTSKKGRIYHQWTNIRENSKGCTLSKREKMNIIKYNRMLKKENCKYVGIL